MMMMIILMMAMMMAARKVSERFLNEATGCVENVN